MTESEMDTYRQVLIEQDKAMHDWQTSRFAGIDETEPSIDQKINANAKRHQAKLGAERRGTRVGYDSPEARAIRKGQHDARSGKLTPEFLMVDPQSYIMALSSEACRYQRVGSAEDLLGKDFRSFDNDPVVADASNELTEGVAITPVNPLPFPLMMPVTFRSFAMVTAPEDPSMVILSKLLVLKIIGFAPRFCNTTLKSSN